jgi:hypothetical protein
VKRAAIITTCCLVVLASGARCALAADEPGDIQRALYPVHALTCPQYLLRGCCCNYCPKPLPCLHCFGHCCGPDDYCAKPYPCIWCYRGSCCGDCYCCKPCPDLCRPLAADYFTCAMGSDACRCAAPNAQNPSDAMSQSPTEHVDVPAEPANNSSAPLLLNPAD